MVNIQEEEQYSQNVQQRTKNSQQKESSVARFFHQLGNFFIFVGCMSID